LGVLISDALAPHWLWRSLHDLPRFPTVVLEVFETSPSPHTVKYVVHPPRSFSPPTEYDGTSPPLRRFRPVVPSMRFPASSRNPRRGSARHDGFHTVAAFRPQVFSTSRRLAPHDAFTGLFHPVCTSRLRPSGSSPRQEPPRLIAERLALLWLPRARLLLRSDDTRSPPTGPCSPGESVARDPQLSESFARSPLGLSPLQGLLHFGRRSRFHDPPLASLPRRTYRT